MAMLVDSNAPAEPGGDWRSRRRLGAIRRQAGGEANAPAEVLGRVDNPVAARADGVAAVRRGVAARVDEMEAPGGRGGAGRSTGGG